jgi:hypothetical protein
MVRVEVPFPVLVTEEGLNVPAAPVGKLAIVNGEVQEPPLKFPLKPTVIV